MPPKDSIKIGFISTILGYPWGGSEEMWYEAACEAISHGHRVIASMHSDTRDATKLRGLVDKGMDLCFHRTSDQTLYERLKISSRIRLLGHQPNFPVESHSPFRHFFAAKPDVICINQGDPYSFVRYPDLMEFLLLSDIPYVVISQGAFPYQVLNYENRVSMRSFFERAEKTVFVASGSHKLVERQIAQRIDNALVLDNPANLKGRGILPFPTTETLGMAFVGRLEVFHKAIDLLFEALSFEEWKGRDWRLNLYGGGADEQYLRDLAVLFGIESKVNFAGQLQDVREAWKENSIAVLTSYSEGLPLSIVEAMLCGRSAVVTNVGGMPELIEDGFSGFVAGCASSESIRVALNRMWERRSELKKLGENAFSRANERFPERQGQRLFELLMESAAAGPVA